MSTMQDVISITAHDSPLRPSVCPAVRENETSESSVTKTRGVRRPGTDALQAGRHS